MQPEHAQRNYGLTRLMPILVFWGTALCLLGADAINGSTVQDIDDIARQLQIADLLRDGDWHDLTWPFLSMPEPYVSPWSRLVDIPYVLLTWLFQPVLGQESAFAVARFLVPLLWLIPYAWLATRLIEEILDGRPSLVQTGAAAAASLFAVIEFMPNRIDHHNVQIVLLLALCLSVVSQYKFAGVLLGLSILLSFAVGLECAPYIALALTGIAIHAALTPQSAMPRKLTQTGLVLLAATLPVGLVLKGGTLFQTHCDALSSPWVSALMAGGIIAAGAPALWKLARLTSPVSRLAVLCGGGALALMALWLAFPDCHAGPYSMINETARIYWLSNVIQEKGPAGAFARGENLLVFIFLLLLALTLAAWACPKAYRSPVLILLLIASLGTLLSAWQMRNFRFPAALLPLFLPLFIERVQHLKSMRPALAALILPILLLGLFAISVKPDGRHLTLIDYMEGDACAEADLAVLDDMPPSRIMAPLGLSLTLSEHISKTGSGHKVAALPFHRASAGMERMFQTFVLTDTKLRRDALAPYDFVAICTLPDTGNTPSQAPVFAALSSGKDWPGLTDVSEPGASRFRLLAIEHASVE